MIRRGHVLVPVLIASGASVLCWIGTPNGRERFLGRTTVWRSHCPLRKPERKFKGCHLSKMISNPKEGCCRRRRVSLYCLLVGNPQRKNVTNETGLINVTAKNPFVRRMPKVCATTLRLPLRGRWKHCVRDCKCAGAGGDIFYLCKFEQM